MLDLSHRADDSFCHRARKPATRVPDRQHCRASMDGCKVSEGKVWESVAVYLDKREIQMRIGIDHAAKEPRARRRRYEKHCRAFGHMPVCRNQSIIRDEKSGSLKLRAKKLHYGRRRAAHDFLRRHFALLAGLR